MSSVSARMTHSRTLPFLVPSEAAELLDAASSVLLARTSDELMELAVRDAVHGVHEVAYDVPGKGRIVEATVCAVKNGIAANYTEAYMRRRDPDCMVIGDERPTDKPTYQSRYGEPFGELRQETLDWLKTQRLAVFPFYAGVFGKGTPAMVIAPDNAGFFALGLAMLQSIVPAEQLPEDFAPTAIIYVAPPFRHSHFDG